LPYYNRKNLLKLTLDSFQYFYANNADLEIVIIDDGSNVENKIDDIITLYNLNIKLITIKNKNGINPCYVYNVGVRESSGDILVLSSPETLHTTNMFTVSNNFNELNDATYVQFSVFCLTDMKFKEYLLSVKNNFCNKLEYIEQNNHLFYEDLGVNTDYFNNVYGSWYIHSKICPSSMNFFSAITRKTYYTLSGFDERFRYGVGYDDEEFANRVVNTVDNIVWIDNAVAIHIDHEIVAPLSNMCNLTLFNEVKTNAYKQNNTWGQL